MHVMAGQNTIPALGRCHRGVMLRIRTKARPAESGTPLKDAGERKFMFVT